MMERSPLEDLLADLYVTAAVAQAEATQLRAQLADLRDKSAAQQYAETTPPIAE